MVRCELRYGDGTLDVRLPGRPKLLLPQKTTPAPNPERAIRILVEELNRIGVRDEQIFAVIANETHRPMTRDEIRTMEEALTQAYAKLGPNPRTYILPQGGLVFPWVRKSEG